MQKLLAIIKECNKIFLIIKKPLFTANFAFLYAIAVKSIIFPVASGEKPLKSQPLTRLVNWG